MKYPRKVYCIRHNPTDRVYIGSSSNVDRRFMAHIHALRRGDHIVGDMQEDYNLHGEDYTLTVLDTIESEGEKNKEYEWMKTYGSNERGRGYNYNDKKNVDGVRSEIKGKKMTPEEELLYLIRTNKNPERALVVAFETLIDYHRFDLIRKARNFERRTP